MATSLLLLILSIIVYLPAIYSISSTTDNSNEPRYPSLYQQYCCIDDNRGKNFIITTTEVNKYIICPPETPDSCNNVIKSCSDVLARNASAVSGYYNITLANGTIVNQYCDTEPFGCEGDGWTRIDYLNMADPNQTCPAGFILVNYAANIRYCTKPALPVISCQSVTFSPGISYTQVCGRVIGYQIGLLWAVWGRDIATDDVLDRPYVDGVSITRGSPRKHIWTFMATTYDNSDNSNNTSNGLGACPCQVGGFGRNLSFVANDYSCESGNPSSNIESTVHISDPVWDGKQCGSHDCYCTNPWFNKVLDVPTTEYVELRLCDYWDQGDPALILYELYVK